MEELFTKVDSLFVDGIFSGLIAIAVYILIVSVLKSILGKIILKQDWKQKILINKIKNIVLNVLLLIGVFSQFTFMSSLSSTLLASGGIVAVVVGLASQEAASNIVGGMMILFSKPFNIGDTIVLKDNGLRGTVKDINLSHTIIETIDKTVVMIPNVTMNKSIIENITHDTEFKVAYLTVDVSYESDLQKAMDIMKDIVTKHELFYDLNPESDDKAPVHCMNLGDSGISLRVKVTTRNAGDSFQICSDCRILIKEAFDANGIEIPYPHIQIKQ